MQVRHSIPHAQTTTPPPTATHTHTHTQVAEGVDQFLHSAETEEAWRLRIVVDTNVMAIFFNLKSTPYSDLRLYIANTSGC
jgi:hypothetical protein